MAAIRRRIVLPGHGREEPEWPVLLTVALALIIGIAIQSTALGRTETVTVENVSLSYPSTWTGARDRGSLFAVSDLRGGGFAGPRASVRKVPKSDLVRTNDAPLADAATAWTLSRARDLDNYTILGMEPTRVGDKEALRIDYGYVASSTLGSGGALPAVLRGSDTIVGSGDQFYILSLVAPSADFDRLSVAEFPRTTSIYNQIVSSWRVP